MTRPVPTNLKVLNGNPGRRPMNHAEPDPDYLQDLTPPQFLTSEKERRHFSRNPTGHPSLPRERKIGDVYAFGGPRRPASATAPYCALRHRYHK